MYSDYLNTKIMIELFLMYRGCEKIQNLPNFEIFLNPTVSDIIHVINFYLNNEYAIMDLTGVISEDFNEEKYFADYIWYYA